MILPPSVTALLLTSRYFWFFQELVQCFFPFPSPLFFFFLFPLGVFITSFYELYGQCPRFSSKRHVCMSLSRHSFEGSELLSNKTCIIGKTCSTNLPLLQIHNCLIDRNSSFSWSFLNYPLRIFCLQARTWALNVSYFTVIHATLKSLGCSSDFFFPIFFFKNKGLTQNQVFVDFCWYLNLFFV